MVDRKAALLDKERRFREQEERQQEQESREEQTRLQQLAQRRRGGGMARLGPVQPREDDIPQFLPAPMQIPPPKAGVMEIKISKETAERAKGPAEKVGEPPVEEDDDDEEELAEDEVLAFLRLEKAKKVKAAKVPEAKAAKPPKKKRKRTRGAPGEEGEDVAGEDEELVEDDDGDGVYDPYAQVASAVARHRDGGVNKNLMVIDSVKGKVSTANRNFTDADLERRFALPDAGMHSGLMTEEEVLRMIRKEKQDKGAAATGSASRRVQRELAEWAAAKEQQRARVKSPHRFERMVVSRK